MKTTAFWEWVRDWISLRILREPPRQPVYWVLVSTHLARALYVAAKLRVADYLLHKPMTCAELARKTKANETSLGRLMNSLAAFGYFETKPDGRFAITPAGHSLSSFTEGPDRDWLLWVGHEINWKGYEYAVECVKQGRSGFELAHGKPMYDFLDEHPEIGECFLAGMNGWSRWQGKEILGAFDFSRYRTIVDVGGGRGGLMGAILSANPASKGILFDRQNAVDLARKDFEENGLADRCGFESGSFFETVFPGGDLYILKQILRDWSDEDAARILRSCREAMEPGCPLILVEGVVDPANGRDRLQKLIDLEQMFWLEGRMRTKKDWTDLFGEAGFKLERIRHTKIADVSVLEFRKN